MRWYGLCRLLVGLVLSGLTVVSLPACGGGSAAAAPGAAVPAPSPGPANPAAGKTGLVAYALGWDPAPAKVATALRLASDSRVKVYSFGYQDWKETEPQAGVYDWRELDTYFAEIERGGYRFDLALDVGGFLDYNGVELPPGLQFRGFGDSELFDRYTRFLGALLDRYGNKLQYLLLHSEGATEYFTKHPEQLADYIAFWERVVPFVKTKAPRIKVGISLNHYDRADIVQGINRTTDFVSFMFYPDYAPVDRVTDPARTGELFRRMIERAGSKRIAIQDGGWSSSPRVGQSEERQAQFVRELFTAMRAQPSTFEYVSYFALYDDPRSIYESVFPGQEELIVWLSSLGLWTVDGRAKPAWEEFKRQVESYHQATGG